MVIPPGLEAESPDAAFKLWNEPAPSPEIPSGVSPVFWRLKEYISTKYSYETADIRFTLFACSYTIYCWRKKRAIQGRVNRLKARGADPRRDPELRKMYIDADNEGYFDEVLEHAKRFTSAHLSQLIEEVVRTVIARPALSRFQRLKSFLHEIWVHIWIVWIAAFLALIVTPWILLIIAQLLSEYAMGRFPNVVREFGQLLIDLGQRLVQLSG